MVQRTRSIGSTIALVALTGFSVGAWANPPVTLSFIGMAEIPTGTRFEATEVGGLSGIDYDAANERYVAISDNRGAQGPVRYYDLTIDLSDGQLADGDVQFTGVTEIQALDGQAFAPGVADPESLRITAFPGLLYWTSEGNAATGLAPFVRVMTRGGAPIAAFAIPDVFRPATRHGIRNNLAFESLTHALNQNIWLTATENALIQDGPAATLEHGSPARVLCLDGATGKPLAQYVYRTAAVAAAPEPADGFATNGLSELLAIAPDTYIALERSFSTGIGNDIRLYLTHTHGATDVSGRDSIRNTRYHPMKKHLLLDLATLDIDLDNIEGITLGPTVHGHPTLVLVADDNFSTTQRTQFLAFTLDGPLVHALAAND
ncbi:esterase-like activity of phytase family protein [Salinisphaera japonica]|uniref:Phytase-like domain-containing protein n=1 Tax=Salinisphaera japonica YTM-1 TaxID=1209778 RepID=A0A423Q0G1_9GAMM|nr:esterase-like activity of phytase family protein [Salinisphaera japonica]ROO31409.1 hypothetical protein SAJA_02700 [Salinisphaera japonica YTM-1]